MRRAFLRSGPRLMDERRGLGERQERLVLVRERGPEISKHEGF